VDKNGVRTHIPVGDLACIMLEPGTRVTHAAVTLASRVGCCWSGPARVGFVFMPQDNPESAIDRLLYQAKLALDDEARLKVVRKMYEMRFKEKFPRREALNN